MTNEEADKFHNGAIPEIDDVHYAAHILGAIRNYEPEAKMLKLAKMLAYLRERYVEIGRTVESHAVKAHKQESLI